MKLTKLSLIAALSMNVAFAGGTVLAPVEPVVMDSVADASNNNRTTVTGKMQGYYITNDTADSMFDKTQQIAGATTLNVTHSLMDNLKLNFSAIGYVNAFNKNGHNYGYLESNKRGAFFNVANIQADLDFMDTTIIAGRQLIDSPMFGSYDWLLSPSSFEAYTVVNKSIPNVALIGTYVTKHRGHNAGSDWTKIVTGTKNNFAAGAVYNDSKFSGNAWYYNIDAKKYTQMYADAGFDMGIFNIGVQGAMTDYKTGDDSTAYGLKLGTSMFGFYLTAAANMVSDRNTAYIDRDALYASSWMTFASDAAVAGEDTLSWKVSTGYKFAGIDTQVSYGAYGDDTTELDVIMGVDFLKNTMNLQAIYSMVDTEKGALMGIEKANTLEVLGTYKF